MPVCHLHLTGNAWESELPLMNVCSLFLSQAHKNGGKSIMDENTTAPSTPGLQETCRPCKSQAQRGRRRAALPPLSLRLKTNRGNQLSSQTHSSVTAWMFIVALGILWIRQSWVRHVWGKYGGDVLRPYQEIWSTSVGDSVCECPFFQRLPSALLIQSLPGIPAHIVSALAPLHTCSVW